MSQRLYCSNCAKNKPQSGTHLLYPATSSEPAEYGRFVWGQAKLPQPEHRVMYITTSGVSRETHSEEIRLPLFIYNCDLCNTEIHPGDRCCAITYWTSSQPEQPEPPRWEDEFLEPFGT